MNFPLNIAQKAFFIFKGIGESLPPVVSFLLITELNGEYIITEDGYEIELEFTA
jgi:hypothetical protein